ncbi:MAG: Smr/MutS family protein, partial [Inhella sp.]|uniref:Smr/MutS family protein n=1 Tax=Inhella sp. TaxID=1921806 RepID=UPI00391D7EA5
MSRSTAYKGLASLAVLQRELQARRAAEAAAVAAERERLERLERERQLFARSVGPVTPLPDPGLAPATRQRPTPEPRSLARDEQAVLVEAWSDDFDVDSLLETDSELSFKRPSLPPQVLSKLRRGHWSIQAELDLHGLRSDEARQALAEFLHACERHGKRCVRVIHGKGHGSPGKEGVLRVKARRWLVQRDEVLAFVQATPAQGGAGALVVLLQG